MRITIRKVERYSFLAFSIIVFLCLNAETRRKAKITVQRPAKVEHYLKKYKYLSIELSQNQGVPIAITLAVAGLESNWGESQLAKDANNHFGIKVKPYWKGKKYCKQTLEYEDGKPIKVDDCFRRYSYIRESYWDFGAFLTTQDHYKWMLDLSKDDLAGWANGMQKGGYATDPAYAQKLMRLIETYRLDEVE